MSPKEIFGLVIRVLGLLLSILGVWYLISTVSALVSPETPGTNPFHEYLIWALIFLAAGLYFLRGAPHIIRFSYPEPRPDSERKTSA